MAWVLDGRGPQRPPGAALSAEPGAGARRGDPGRVEYGGSRSRRPSREARPRGGAVGFIEGRTLWKQSVAEAKASGDVSRGAGIFVARLAQGHDFDAVVLPSLIVHQTQMDHSNASWDGVSRRMKMLNAPHEGIGREDSTLERGVEFVHEGVVRAFAPYLPPPGE